MKYTQDTMEEALRKVKLMRADLGGTEILAPLQNIYSTASIPGHPLQVRIGAEPEGGLHSARICALSSCGAVGVWCARQRVLPRGEDTKTRAFTRIRRPQLHAVA